MNKYEKTDFQFDLCKYLDHFFPGVTYTLTPYRLMVSNLPRDERVMYYGKFVPQFDKDVSFVLEIGENPFYLDCLGCQFDVLFRSAGVGGNAAYFQGVRIDFSAPVKDDVEWI